MDSNVNDNSSNIILSNCHAIHEILFFPSCDSGFFSNCNIILSNTIMYFNIKKKLPVNVEASKMFGIYKTDIKQNIYELIFETENSNDFLYVKNIKFNNEDYENQFSDYKRLNLNDIQPFFQKYFKPKEIILNNVNRLLQKYNINYHDEICGVFFRGNDKIKETTPPTYDEIIQKSKCLKQQNKNIKFIIQTDEVAFLNKFMEEFSDALYFKEIPVMDSDSSTNISRNLVNENKFNHVIDFVSIIYIFSKLKYLITTSGNCELFIIFFRNNTNNLYQYLKKNKYIHGTLNKEFDENNLNFWH